MKKDTECSSLVGFDKVSVGGESKYNRENKVSVMKNL